MAGMNAAESDQAPVNGLPDFAALSAYVRERQRVSVSTYRLQLHGEFTFRDAAAIVPYLDRLGISACYCSPYLQARPGSQHGYDICDHSRLNEELGTEADYDAFVSAMATAGIGQVLDIVPNHMGADPISNPWWRDVLENGPSSFFAHYFDIDWDPIKPELKRKVLLATLGDHYGQVLERGELRLDLLDGTLVLRYGEQHFPIDPRHYGLLLRYDIERIRKEMREEPSVQELLAIVRILDELPTATDTNREKRVQRRRVKDLTLQRFARLLESSPRIKQYVHDCTKALNGEPGKPESFDRLHELLELQPYRLAYWKTAVHEINYRRFFDISTLAAVRMESPDVFAATHTLLLKLVRKGQVTGLRLDHIDGLFDPEGYVDTLQQAILEQWVAEFAGIPEVPVEWQQPLREWRNASRLQEPHGHLASPLYVLAEKILTGHESLPQTWPIHGTSGYDFLNDLNRLFLDPTRMKEMRRVYERFTGHESTLADMIYDCKKLIAKTSLGSELNVLAHALNRISEGDRRTRDFTLYSLHQALREVVTCFPVYRTYVRDSEPTEADRQNIERAIARAIRRNRAMEPSIFDFVRATLLPNREELTEEEYQRRLQFAMKFQQYTGPVEAKGLEDTTFYRYNVLLSLNEVGGDPQRFGGTVDQYHESNLYRLKHWPNAMLCTATHDHKRGEDARARLNLLSEMPREWQSQVVRWSRLNARNRTDVDGDDAPDRNDEYFFYQSLVGAWRAEYISDEIPERAPDVVVTRMHDYLTKAIKEAKAHTSWINPNQFYDQAVVDFVEKTLSGPRAGRFLADFLPFQRRIAHLGMINSLSQVILKIVAVGVPDFYQGTELWDYSLVDPDNRRPVDYLHREQLLKSLEPALVGAFANPPTDRTAAVTEMLNHWVDGRIKLYITALGLRLRRQHRTLFLDGQYAPLAVVGEKANHIVASLRVHGDDRVLAVVPRLVGGLVGEVPALPIGEECWMQTRLLLPPETAGKVWYNLVTGEKVTPVRHEDGFAIPVGEILKTCSVSLLKPAPDGT
jgi:(1->4)-alpha-D-glucan 1-alpha-D-glucosylmutase